jgi:hypothetical protein
MESILGDVFMECGDESDLLEEYLSENSICDYFETFLSAYYGCYCQGMSIAYDEVSSGYQDDFDEWFQALLSGISGMIGQFSCEVKSASCDLEDGSYSFSLSAHTVSFTVDLGSNCDATDDELYNAVRVALSQPEANLVVERDGDDLVATVTFGVYSNAEKFRDDVSNGEYDAALSSQLSAVGDCDGTITGVTIYQDSASQVTVMWSILLSALVVALQM